MRKTLIDSSGERRTDAEGWLDLTRIASAEMTSEDPRFPLEHALQPGTGVGWRAEAPGPQRIRLRFDDEIELHRIQIHCADRAGERTQQLTVLVEMAGLGLQEIARTEFHFTPQGSTDEVEDLSVELAHVTLLELAFDPDGKPAGQSQSYAVMTSLRLA